MLLTVSCGTFAIDFGVGGLGFTIGIGSASYGRRIWHLVDVAKVARESVADEFRPNAKVDVYSFADSRDR